MPWLANTLKNMGWLKIVPTNKLNKSSQLTSVSCLGFCKNTQKHKSAHSGNCYWRYERGSKINKTSHVFDLWRVVAGLSALK